VAKFVTTNCDVCGEWAKCIRMPLLSTSISNRKFLDFCIDCVRQAAVRFLGGNP
jgi:hypothetical protein